MNKSIYTQAEIDIMVENKEISDSTKMIYEFKLKKYLIKLVADNKELSELLQIETTSEVYIPKEDYVSINDNHVIALCHKTFKNGKRLPYKECKALGLVWGINGGTIDVVATNISVSMFPLDYSQNTANNQEFWKTDRVKEVLKKLVVS